MVQPFRNFRSNEEEYKDIAKFRRKAHDVNKKKRLLVSVYKWVTCLFIFWLLIVYEKWAFNPGGLLDRND